MKKKIAALVASSAILLTALPVFAKGPAYDQMVSKGGEYKLVSKDTTTWEILSPSENPFGKVKFEVDESGQMTAHLIAHKLTPDYWYYVELVDKSSGWNPFNDDRYSSFYGQADKTGKLDMTFAWDVSGHSSIEINVKNADWVALEEPSDYGNEDGDWIYTGQGWDYVLYGATLIP